MEIPLTFDLSIFVKTTKILTSPTVKIYLGVSYFYLKATYWVEKFLVSKVTNIDFNFFTKKI